MVFSELDYILSIKERNFMFFYTFFYASWRCLIVFRVVRFVVQVPTHQVERIKACLTKK